MNGQDVFYEDSMQYAKDLAQADRELNIVQWVKICFTYRENYTTTILHTIDIPRTMLERWNWLIQWRAAKLTCKHPRKNIFTTHSYYDKRTGLETGFNTLLSQLRSRKAQVTRVERIIKAYVAYESQDNIFFDATTDERLLKAKKKLEQKKQNYEVLFQQVEQAAKQHQMQNL